MKSWKEILFIDTLSQNEIKTKNGETVLKNLSKVPGFKPLSVSKKKKALVALFGRNEKTEKTFRNLPQVDIVFLKNLNPLEILEHKYLLIENGEEGVKFLEARGSRLSQDK